MPPPGREPLTPAPVIGLVLLAGAFFLYAVSGTINVPWWGVAALMVLWLVLLVVALRSFQDRPRRVLWIGVAAVALWLPVVLGGAAWLGWEA